MPDESCRTCGGNLIDCTLCAQCKGVIGMICSRCGERTLEQFHDNCMFRVEKFQTHCDLESQTGIISTKILTIA